MKYNLGSVLSLMHNGSLLTDAENTINQFINHDEFTVWITDSEGNHFMPKGNITVNYINMKLEEDN